MKALRKARTLAFGALAAGSVDANKLEEGAVTEGKIAVGAVKATNLGYLRLNTDKVGCADGDECALTVDCGSRNVFGGGFYTSSSGVQVLHNYPSTDTVWSTAILNDSGNEVSFQVFAVCGG